MKPQKGGVIVNVSSIRAFQPDGLAAAYVAAKGELDSVTYDPASLYGRVGTRVFVETSPGDCSHAAPGMPSHHPYSFTRKPRG
jgi:NAD(P)-dependent dehydrogenase (short-subunit alcohol dehydrogenase family)